MSSKLVIISDDYQAKDLYSVTWHKALVFPKGQKCFSATIQITILDKRKKKLRLSEEVHPNYSDEVPLLVPHSPTKSQTKTVFWKSRADLKPWWKNCSRAATRLFSPHSSTVRLPLCGETSSSGSDSGSTRETGSYIEPKAQLLHLTGCFLCVDIKIIVGRAMMVLQNLTTIFKLGLKNF